MNPSDFPDEDLFLESFVDVLSCGLGAAILLFLIFAVMPHAGNARLSVAGTAAAPLDIDGELNPAATVIYQLIISASGQDASSLRLEPSDERINRNLTSTGVIFDWFVEDGRQTGKCLTIVSDKRPAVGNLTVSAVLLIGGVVRSEQRSIDHREHVAAIYLNRPNDWFLPNTRCSE